MTPSSRNHPLANTSVGCGSTVFKAYPGDAVSDRLAAVPGAVFGNEYLSPVVGWKHLSGIKPHSQGDRMGCQFQCRWIKLALGCLVAENRVGDIVAVNLGEAEVTAC